MKTEDNLNKNKKSRCSTRKRTLLANCKPNSQFLVSLYDVQPTAKRFERNLHSRQQNRGTKIAEKTLDFELERNHKRPFTAKNKQRRTRLTNEKFWLEFKGLENQSITAEKSIKSKYSKRKFHI